MRYPNNGKITQGFSAAHQAVDIADKHQAPVYAPHTGKVTHAGQLGSGTSDAGLAVDIDGGRFKSRLGHNDQILVKVGQYVQEGQVVAKQGFTGYTRPDNVVQGSHTHWVLWDGQVRVDGRKYVVPPPKPPVSKGKTLYLPASAARWRVYPLDKAPKVGNEKGFIRPALFGGLKYAILDMPNSNVAIIQTRDFGKVKIWVAPDTGARIK